MAGSLISLIFREYLAPFDHNIYYGASDFWKCIYSHFPLSDLSGIRIYCIGPILIMQFSLVNSVFGGLFTSNIGGLFSTVGPSDKGPPKNLS